MNQANGLAGREGPEGWPNIAKGFCPGGAAEYPLAREVLKEPPSFRPDRRGLPRYRTFALGAKFALGRRFLLGRAKAGRRRIGDRGRRTIRLAICGFVSVSSWMGARERTQGIMVGMYVA